MTAATPQTLAAMGTAARPDLANRMAKAARLVAAGAVTLTGPATSSDSVQATVISGSRRYTVNGRFCNCAWQRNHPGSWCSHALAARMARALAQAEPEPAPVGAPTPESEPALNERARRKLEIARRVSEDSQRDRAAYRRWFHSSEGKRAYLLQAAANGAHTFDPTKFAIATGLGQEDELAAAKERALRELGLR